MSKKLKYGPIYKTIELFIEIFKYLNVVELFKALAKQIYKKNTLLSSRVGVDVFIIMKWLFIILLWKFQVSSRLVNIIIWYLIATNLYTYFYYHIWTDDLVKGHFKFGRIKMRFINLMLALTFNITCFAYLYVLPFTKNFQWIDNSSKNIDALLLSISNSFTMTYAYAYSITKIGQTLMLFETIITFIFLTIILSNSIPQIKGK